MTSYAQVSRPATASAQVLREDGGFDYKKAIVESILILIREIPDAKESGLAHLCEFIEVPATRRHDRCSAVPTAV